jgi:uracil-DNA glycosylase family 4
MTLTPCFECPDFRPVPASGASPCPYLFIGAGPGKSEARSRIPYTGRAGEELDNTYLPIAGMRREEVCVGNATLCWDGTDRIPSEARVLACARHHLPRLLDQVKPEVVILMGGVTKALADKPLRMETHEGIPQWTSLLGGVWEGWVWPSYEPALGMRETGKMNQLLASFRHLGEWVNGEWTPPVPPIVEKDYRVVNDIDKLRQYLSLYGHRPPALDTEKHGTEPWSVQFSLSPHTGRLIKADRVEVLEMFQDWLEQWELEVILHFAGQDLDTLEKMGVRPVSFRDTGQEAYQLCFLPQGLKPLAYRLLGVTMRSWEDVVWPASIKAVTDWMEQAEEFAANTLSDTMIQTLTMAPCKNCGKRGKGMVCKVCGEPRQFTRKLRLTGAVEAILKHVRKHTLATAEAEKPYDPWVKLPEMKAEGLRGKVAEEWEWEAVELELGSMPILGIGNCDEEEAVEYAIGDADYTGQVAAEMERLRGGDRWRVAEEDRDV